MGLCSDELGQRQYTLSAPQRSTERPVVTGQSGALAGRFAVIVRHSRENGNLAALALCWREPTVCSKTLGPVSQHGTTV